MKYKKNAKKSVRTRKPNGPAAKPDYLSLDLLSGYALIHALRGCCKGTDSLVTARELEVKREERAWIKRRKVRSEKTSS